MKYQILQGDNRTTLKTLPDNSVDAIVTDPPYGIDFLGKAWDANTGALETYQECLRVLKPGGHILAFSAARTYHHLAVTLEQAGFEIRDQIMWIYSSGFPKSQDVGRQLHKKEHGKPDKQRFNKDEMEQHYSPGGGSNGFGRLAFSETQPAKNAQTTLWRHKENGKIYKALPDINGDRLAVSHEGQGYGVVYEEVIEVNNAWSGWGTCLKPAHEPIALARKPIKLSIAQNCQKHGVGALNIDATRVPYEDAKDIETYLNNKKGPMERSTATDGEGIGMFEGKVGYKTIKREVSAEEDLPEQGRFPSNVIGEIPDYQKYFYCPKVSRRERHIGHETPPPMFGDVEGAYGPDGNRMAVGFDNRAVIDRKDMVAAMGGKWVNDAGEHLDAWTPDANAKSVWLPGKGDIRVHGLTHEYAEWCKANGKDPGNVGNNHPTVKPIELMKYLIRLITPAGGTVLDPFNGSGSTGCAAVELGYEYIGCELDEKYVDIARRRIEAWYESCNPTTFHRLFDLD